MKILGLCALSTLMMLVGHAPVAFAANDGFVLAMSAVDRPLDEAIADVEHAHRLGATHFNIQVGLCQKNKTSTEVFWCDDHGGTERYKTRILRLARELRTRGFTTGLLPMLLSTEDGLWRGFFEPSDFRAWSASYLARLLELADLAKAARVSDFIVGTELSKLYVAPDPGAQPERTSFWREACSRVRERLGTGISVILVANWDQVEQIPFWDASDLIGMSAYFPLATKVGDDTSVEALAARWVPWQKRLLALAERNGNKPLYFSEVGYASQANAAHEPWGWDGALDLELQRRLFSAFGAAWSHRPEVSGRLARFMLWALDSPPESPMTDTGFDVLGKPAERVLPELFRRDRGGVAIPVIFTMDDFPMWFVESLGERLAAFRAIRETLARHHVPGIGFVNSAGMTRADWAELLHWRNFGFVFANHTAHHLVRSTTSEEAFFRDVDEGERALRSHGLFPQPFFRYPNLDYGSGDAERLQTCRKIRERGYLVVPTSFDTRDWSWGESYHMAAGESLEARGDGGARAQEIAAQGLADLTSRFVAPPADAPSPLLLMMHSTRFARDYLENILTELEARGARWVAPTRDALAAYAGGDACLPACLSTGRCN